MHSHSMVVSAPKSAFIYQCTCLAFDEVLKVNVKCLKNHVMINRTMYDFGVTNI